MILEQAPATDRTIDEGNPFEAPSAPELPVVPWMVSARSESGVTGQFARLAGFLRWSGLIRHRAWSVVRW